MSKLINLGDIGPVQVHRYPHGGGRVWRETDDGERDLLLDLYGPAERRDAIIERLSGTHAATVAALEERVAELEKINTRYLKALEFYAEPDNWEQMDCLGLCEMTSDYRDVGYGHEAPGKRACEALAPTEEGGR